MIGRMILYQSNQPTIITKVIVHANIDGNERADKLAKDGSKLAHSLSTQPYKNAHSISYHLHKDTWPPMDTTPYKGPIRHLQPYLIKYDHAHTLELTARTFPNINKWFSDENIDIETSTTFWNHPLITDAQKTCILKFRYNQYMDNACKQLFFGPHLYPTISCSICNSLDPDTWKHVLLSCKQHQIHALCIKRHNKAIWEICKLLIQSNKSRCLFLCTHAHSIIAPLKIWFLHGYYRAHVQPTNVLAM